ncbi:MAG: gliding motility-associated C-terminal domain-containing protein, partial [Saprospiraceae bacterium]
FDRWGAEIYSKSNGTFNENGEDYGWDGSYKNSDLIPGVYTYIIQYETLGLGNKWVTGSITLLK